MSFLRLQFRSSQVFWHVAAASRCSWDDLGSLSLSGLPIRDFLGGNARSQSATLTRERQSRLAPSEQSDSPSCVCSLNERSEQNVRGKSLQCRVAERSRRAKGQGRGPRQRQKHRRHAQASLLVDSLQTQPHSGPGSLAANRSANNAADTSQPCKRSIMWHCHVCSGALTRDSMDPVDHRPGSRDTTQAASELRKDFFKPCRAKKPRPRLKASRMPRL